MKKGLFGILAICMFFGVRSAVAGSIWGQPMIRPSMSLTMGPFGSVSTSAPAFDIGMPIGYGKCTFTQVNGTASRTFILQGSNISASAGFTNDVSVTVTNNPATWAFFFNQIPNEWWRGRCDSGCGIGNEITVECTFGGLNQ